MAAAIHAQPGPVIRNMLDRTNATIDVLGALACGEVVVLPRPRPSWEEASARQREISLMVARRWTTWVAHLAAAPPRSEALRLVGAASLSEYGGGLPQKQEAHLIKGELCPINVERLSLPPPGTTPVDLEEISPTAAAYLSKLRRRMLRPKDDVDWERHSKQQVYADDVFKRKADLLRLCERMWLAGMLEVTNRVEAEVAAFGVVKGYTDEGELKIRAVWDERKPNMLWEEPPFIPLGSPATLCHVDLSDLTGDRAAFSAVGDLPDWFYRLRLPRDMWPWFCIGGVTVDEFTAYLRQRGHIWNLGPGKQLCITVLVMGWSWAPFLAHSALIDLLDAIHGTGLAQKRLIYGHPAPQITGSPAAAATPISWGYIDDYGALVVSGGDEGPEQARAAAEAWGTKTRHGMEEYGFPVHKELVEAALSVRPSPAAHTP